MVINQNPVVIFGQTLKYKVDCSVLQGESLIIDIRNIPRSNTNNPLTYSWAMLEEPEFSAGQQNWSTGTFIQGANGTLTSTTQDKLTITAPIPIGASQFNVGKYFSFTFVLDPLGSPNTGIQNVFYVYAVSTTPNSPSLLPNPNNKNDVITVQDEGITLQANPIKFNYTGGAVETTYDSGTNTINVGINSLVDYASTSVFPSTGIIGKIYLDRSSKLLYWWNGTQYEGIGGASGGGGGSSGSVLFDTIQLLTDAQKLQARKNTLSEVKQTITVGNIGSGADYICTGTNDNLVIQQVADYIANTLNNTYRTVLFLDGTYSFSAVTLWTVGNVQLKTAGTNCNIVVSSSFTDISFTDNTVNRTRDALFSFYQNDPNKIITNIDFRGFKVNFNSKRVNLILIHPNLNIDNTNTVVTNNISSEQVIGNIQTGYDVPYVYVENLTTTDQWVSLGLKASDETVYNVTTNITNFNSSDQTESDKKTILGLLRNPDFTLRKDLQVGDGNIFTSIQITNNDASSINFRLRVKANFAGDENLQPLTNFITVGAGQTITLKTADLVEQYPFNTSVNVKIDNSGTNWTSCNLSFVFTLRKTAPSLAGAQIVPGEYSFTIPNMCLRQYKLNQQNFSQSSSASYKAVDNAFRIKKWSYLKSVTLTNNSDVPVTITRLSAWDYRFPGDGKISEVQLNFTIQARSTHTVTIPGGQGSSTFPYMTDGFFFVQSGNWADMVNLENGTSTLSLTANFGIKYGFNREIINRIFPKIANQDIYIQDVRKTFTTNCIRTTLQKAPVCGNFNITNNELIGYNNNGDEGAICIYASKFVVSSGDQNYFLSKCVVNNINITDNYIHDSSYNYNSANKNDIQNAFRMAHISIIGTYVDNVKIERNTFERLHGWTLWTDVDDGSGLAINIRARKNWSFSANTCTRTKTGTFSSITGRKLVHQRKHDFSDESRFGFDGLKWEGNVIFDGTDSIFSGELASTSDQFDEATEGADIQDIAMYSSLQCMNTKGLQIRFNKFTYVKTCIDVGYTNPYGNEGFLVDFSNNILDTCQQLGDVDGHYIAHYSNNIFYRISQMNFNAQYGFQAPKTYINNTFEDCCITQTFTFRFRAMIYLKAGGVSFINNRINFTNPDINRILDYIFWVDAPYNQDDLAYSLMDYNPTSSSVQPVTIKDNIITGVVPAEKTFNLSYNQNYHITGNQGVIEDKIVCLTEFKIKNDGILGTVILDTPKVPKGVIRNNYKRNGEKIDGERITLTGAGDYTIDAPYTDLYINKTVPEYTDVFIDTTTWKNGDRVEIKDDAGNSGTYDITVYTDAPNGIEGKDCLIISNNYANVVLLYYNGAFRIK